MALKIVDAEEDRQAGNRQRANRDRREGEEVERSPITRKTKVQAWILPVAKRKVQVAYTMRHIIYQSRRQPLTQL